MWEYREGYRDLSSACIQNHIVEYLDCDFIGVKMVTLLFGDGSGVIREKHAYFVLNVRRSGLVVICVERGPHAHHSVRET